MNFVNFQDSEQEEERGFQKAVDCKGNHMFEKYSKAGDSQQRTFNPGHRFSANAKGEKKGPRCNETVGRQLPSENE